MGGGSSYLEKSVAIIPKVGGALSLVACTAIIRDVSIKWHRKKTVPLTSVIVFCISVADWIFSLFGAFLSTWMIPPDSGHYLASGNTQSCTAQGFIVALSIGASMGYYTVLMILYWIVVRFGWTESRMSNWYIRLSFILPPIVISLGFAIPPLFFGMYNDAGVFTCFFAPYPLDCEVNPDVKCVRGYGSYEYWMGFLIYNMVCLSVIIISVGLLIYTVFQQDRKGDKYLLKGQEKTRRNTVKSSWQGLRYIGAFVLAYSTLYIISFYRVTKHIPSAAVVYLLIILLPLLGLFNAFVYFRPRYITYKEKHPDESWVTCLGNIFNIDLDYVEEQRKSMKSIGRRLSSISKLGSISRLTTHDSGDNSSDNGDLTSPLVQNKEGQIDSTVV
ncbi:hypothetical protein ACHAWF_009761 [Thalassiosira exigua]